MAKAWKQCLALLLSLPLFPLTAFSTEPSPSASRELSVEPSPATPSELSLPAGSVEVDYDVWPAGPDAVILLHDSASSHVVSWHVGDRRTVPLLNLTARFIASSITAHPHEHRFFIGGKAGRQSEILVAENLNGSWTQRTIFQSARDLRRLLVAPRPFEIGWNEAQKQPIESYRPFFAERQLSGAYSTRSITAEGKREYQVIGSEAIQHHHVARAQLQAQAMIQVGEKNIAICRLINRHRSDHAARTESAQNGQHLPATIRRPFADAASARSTRIEPCHGSGNTTFVQEYQAFRRDIADFRDKLFAPLSVGFCVTLDGVERLFFSRRFSFRSSRQIRGTPNVMPASACSLALISISVRSGWDATQAITNFCCSAPTRGLRPGLCGTRSACPLRLRAAEIFFAQPRLTRKRPASSSSVPSP